jgi:putative two-component system response regulator
MLEMSLNDPETTPINQISLEKQNKLLKQSVSALERAKGDIFQRLLNVCKYKDNETSNHITRVGAMSRFLAGKAPIPKEEARLIGIAAPMHDIGKLGIPDSILYKPSKLSPSEFEIIKTHTLIGGKILNSPDCPEMEFARQIAMHHHEHWDGSGYPHGLSGEDIPLAARIATVADVFDVMLSWRPYKEPTTEKMAAKYICQNSGILFDPLIVKIFTDNLKDVCKARDSR